MNRSPQYGVGYSGQSGQRHQTSYTTYKLGEKLGPECREREYKEAQGGFMVRQLYDTVARYVSGFLNSQVEGKLILGVNDNAEVVGIDNHYEDKDKRTIDSAMQDLRPSVFPKEYEVAFCDIEDKNGHKIRFCIQELEYSGGIERGGERGETLTNFVDADQKPVMDLHGNRSVVEVTVFKKDNLSSLYQTNKRECWLRRDASTEKMSPEQIQEWLKQRLKDNKEQENLSVLLADKEKQLKDLQQIQKKDNDRLKDNKEQENLSVLLADKEKQLKDLQQQIQKKDNDARNMQNKCELLEKETGRLEQEKKHLEDETGRLQQENEELKQKITQTAEETESSAVQRELQDIKTLLTKKQQSKVCTIS